MLLFLHVKSRGTGDGAHDLDDSIPSPPAYTVLFFEVSYVVLMITASMKLLRSRFTIVPRQIVPCWRVDVANESEMATPG